MKYDIPDVGSMWRHKSGKEYIVHDIANTSVPETEDYPYTIIYENIDKGTMWTRKLSDWHRSFTIIRNGVSL